jgi:hypothetical protein
MSTSNNTTANPAGGSGAIGTSSSMSTTSSSTSSDSSSSTGSGNSLANGDDLVGLANGADNPLAGLLGGSDTILPDTQHLDALGTLGPTLTQIENDANGLLGSLGDLGINPDTVTDVVPNDTGVPDANGLVSQAVDDAQGALNGTGGTGGIGDPIGSLLGDTGTANVLGDTGAPGNAIGDFADGAGTGTGGGLVGDANGALSGAEGNSLGMLGNGSIVDASALPGGAAGSSPLIDTNVDPSQGSSVDVLSADQGGNGNGGVIDADAAPASSLGDVADVGALAAPQTGGDGGINADAGNGQSLLSADALTGTLPDASDATNGSLDDTVNGLLNGSSSSNLVDANAGSQPDDGNVADASVLTAPQSSDGAVGGFVGDGSNIATASALTGNDPLQSSLSNTGADSLVGTLTNDLSATTNTATAPAETASAPTNIADVSTAAGNIDASQIASNVANAAQQATQHALI